MLYGFIYKLQNGAIELHILGFDYHTFIGYTEKQAKKRYRELFGLKYKKIKWI